MNRTPAALITIFLMSSLACSAGAGPRVKVTVDPRIELMSAVQLISGYQDKYGLITRFDFPYKQKMADYFGKYKDHRAVKLFDQMSKEGFCFDGPPELMVYLSDPPGLTLGDLSGHLGREDALMKRAGGEKRMLEFVDALREFARDTDFQRFFKANADTYKAIVDEVDSKVRNWDVVGPLEDYHGSAKPLLATVVLAPLLHDGGYGPKVQHSDGSVELFDICGPSGIQAGRPSWGPPEGVRRLAWHELGHSFANPLVDKNWPALAKYSVLFNPIAPQMRRQAYDNWQTCLREHMVRAVCARLIYKVEGAKAAAEFVGNDSSNGFVYLKPLCKRLEYYETHRDKYPTLESFFPELIGVFKSLNESLRAGQLGPDFYGLKAMSGGPGISPDSSRIAYPMTAFNKDGNWVTQVWVSDLAGSSKKKIAEAVWSPSVIPPSVAWRDDSHIIVFSYVEFGGQIHIVSLDGKQRSLPIPDSYRNLRLAVSPNGKWGAFSAFHDQSGGSWGVFLLNMESGAIRTLSHDAVGSRVSWSPDSAKLAYGASVDPEHGRPNIYKGACDLNICNVETGAVTATGLTGSGAAWSPDGKWLAYTGNVVAGGSWIENVPVGGSIVKMKVETKKMKTLTEPGVNKENDGRSEMSGSLFPLWSPDGGRIAYRRARFTIDDHGKIDQNDELWVMNADGTDRKKLRDTWPPSVWTPDGKALLANTETGIERIAVGTQ